MTSSSQGDVNRNLVDKASRKVSVFLIKRDRFGLESILPLLSVLPLAYDVSSGA